jgi:hypothetical protein
MKYSGEVSISENSITATNTSLIVTSSASVQILGNALKGRTGLLLNSAGDVYHLIHVINNDIVGTDGMYTNFYGFCSWEINKNEVNTTGIGLLLNSKTTASLFDTISGNTFNGGSVQLSVSSTMGQQALFIQNTIRNVSGQPALYVTSESSSLNIITNTIEDCSVRNSRVVTLYSPNGSMKVQTNILSRNTAIGGGIIELIGGSSLLPVDNEFIGNTIKYSSALGTDSSVIKFTGYSWKFTQNSMENNVQDYVAESGFQQTSIDAPYNYWGVSASSYNFRSYFKDGLYNPRLSPILIAPFYVLPNSNITSNFDDLVVTDDTIWGARTLTKSVYVAPGGKLTLTGAINLNENVYIIVSGTLISEGTPNSQVVVNGYVGAWCGIIFRYDAQMASLDDLEIYNSGSRFSYTKFTMSGLGAYTSAIYYSSGILLVENCEMTISQGSAIKSSNDPDSNACKYNIYLLL